MPLEGNLDSTDAMCPDCRNKLGVDHLDRYWCRDCGERKFPELA